MRNLIKATVTKTIDTGLDRVRVIATGNDKLRAFVHVRHLALRHAYRLSAGFRGAIAASPRQAMSAVACWLERMSSAIAGHPAGRQPVCCVPCSSVASG